jgi:pantoate--beta-alanine ligase
MASVSRPQVVRNLKSLRRIVADWRRAGESVALIPTMGALHEGHASLVKAGRRRADRTIVSIFVNPTQFAPTEDFSKYPRTFRADLDKLAAARADLVWAPDAATMYPQGFSTRVLPEGPATAGLEDAFRPHFFGGVATVVSKLFLQALPDIAMFGEKDYQQLQVVTRMAADLDIPVRVIGCPTIREADGLAMSSRNVYLSPQDRAKAPVLHATMQEVAAALRAGATARVALARGAKAITAAGFALDYLEARHARTLAPVKSLKDGPIRLLVAAKIGATRLIDNIGV